MSRLPDRDGCWQLEEHLRIGLEAAIGVSRLDPTAHNKLVVGESCAEIEGSEVVRTSGCVQLLCGNADRVGILTVQSVGHQFADNDLTKLGAIDQFVECFDLICHQWETSVRERFLSVAT